MATFGYWFNQKVDNLPSSLTHAIFGDEFNQKIDNLPFNLKDINILQNKIILLKKIPFDCKRVDL